MSTDAGIKHDQGKPRVSLVVHGFARALLELMLRDEEAWRGGIKSEEEML